MNKLLLLGLVAVMATTCSAVSYFRATHTECKTITVVEKERLPVYDKDSGKSNFEVKVYSEDEVYVVEDSLWNWHWRSATVYAQLQRGLTYDVTVSGYRAGWLSWKQNIIATTCSGETK